MLRNAILIALAIDASPQEVEHAHTIIDRIYGAGGNAGGVDPAYLVTATVPATTAEGVTAHGQQVTTAAPATTAVELDKTGLPWDERIHSSSKENRLNADGTWRSKRGVDARFKQQVEAQLRQTVAAPAPTTAVVTPQPQPLNTSASLPPMPGGNLPPMPGATVADPAYTALVQFIAQNTKSQANPNGKFDDNYISQVLTHYGVADGSLQNLAHRPDLVQPVSEWLHHALTAAA